MMNSTHAAVGVGSISAMDALTTLLTGWQGLDGAHAAALAWLLVFAAGGLGGAMSWFMQWKYPSAPRMPMEAGMQAAVPAAPPAPPAPPPPAAAIIPVPLGGPQ
jgi:hypothetical protein